MASSSTPESAPQTMQTNCTRRRMFGEVRSSPPPLPPFTKLHSASADHAAFHTYLHAAQLRIEQERAAARLSFAAHPPRFAAPLSLTRFRASIRTRGVQPPQIWRSPLPPTLRAGPKPRSPPLSLVSTSRATPAWHIRPLTSGEPFTRQCTGAPNKRGRMPSDSPQPYFPLISTRSARSAC